MRLAFVILIAVVQVAGPWLCCCAPARMSAMLSGKAKAEVTPLAPAKPKASECSHCRKSEPTPTTTPTEMPAPAPSHLPDQCPCGGAELVAVPVAVEVTADWLAPLFAEIALLADAFPTAIPVSVASVPNLRTVPWLTTADRLFGHHVLRC